MTLGIPQARMRTVQRAMRLASTRDLSAPFRMCVFFVPWGGARWSPRMKPYKGRFRWWFQSGMNTRATRLFLRTQGSTTRSALTISVSFVDPRRNVATSVLKYAKVPARVERALREHPKQIRCTERDTQHDNLEHRKCQPILLCLKALLSGSLRGRPT